MKSKAVLFGSVSLLALVSATAAKAQAGFPSWTGPYFGLHGGLAFYQTRFTDTDDLLGFGAGSTFRSFSVGVTAGAHAGYNVQFNSIVLGIVTDINAIHAPWDKNYNGVLVTSEPLWFGTARVRVGYTWGPLVYATAGIAYAQISNSISFPGTSEVSSGSVTNTSYRTGFVWGFGAEKKFDDKYSINVEVLFVDFGRQNLPLVLNSRNGPSNFRTSFQNAIALARAGFSYHW